MEWVRQKDLLISDPTITCCDRSSQVVMVCLSPICRQRQRTVCRKCQVVHKDHQQSLIDIETFVRETSERHDTTKKLKTYCLQKSERDYPTNQIDSIIQGSIVQTKQRFNQRFQAIQDSIVVGMNKIMGKINSFEKTRENVMKLDKKKGDHIGSLPTTSLEMVIDMYWKSDQNSVQEEEVPQKVEVEIQRFNETLEGLLNETFKTIENEVSYHLYQVKKLIKKERVQQFIADGNCSDSEPVRFSVKQKFATIPKRKIIWKNANSDDFQSKVNENHALLEKDLEVLKDNNINILSEDANLHDLSHRYFSTLGEKIEAKKGEIERLEKSKEINTLKFARNQLSNLIRLQVQQSKQFTAQKVRVDSRIHEVIKSLEEKQEEINQSKVMVQKVAKQMSVQRQFERSEYEKSIAGSQMSESQIEGINLYDNIEMQKSQTHQRSKSSYASMSNSTSLVSRNQRSQTKAAETPFIADGQTLKNVSFLTSKSATISNEPSTERGATSERKQRNLQFNGQKSNTTSGKNSIETFPAARASPANSQSFRSSTIKNTLSFSDNNY